MVGQRMSRQISGPRLRTLLFLVVSIGIGGAGIRNLAAQTPVNPGAAFAQEFENRVAEYVKLHKSADSALPPLKRPTESSAEIEHHKHELRKGIVARRPGVVQGNIFSPAISSEFRRLITLAYQDDAKRIQKSLLSSEPGTGRLRIRVNENYPDGIPLQTMPPSLLLNLPALPPELEYRLVGRDLILRDVAANLVVDMVTAAIPR